MTMTSVGQSNTSASRTTKPGQQAGGGSHLGPKLVTTPAHEKPTKTDSKLTKQQSSRLLALVAQQAYLLRNVRNPESNPPRSDLTVSYSSRARGSSPRASDSGSRPLDREPTSPQAQRRTPGETGVDELVRKKDELMDDILKLEALIENSSNSEKPILLSKLDNKRSQFGKL